MRKPLLSLPLIFCTIVSCTPRHEDEFEFAGVVVDYELCTSIQDLGYAVQITSPDTIGGTYLTQHGQHIDHVVVIYNSDRMLHENDSIEGRIFFDLNHSKANCNYHYRETSGDVPEACFSQVRVVK